MGSWGCPHELDGVCQKVNRLRCDPGMKGCVLYGRFTFSNPEKNPPPRPAPVRKAKRDADPTGSTGPKKE